MVGQIAVLYVITVNGDRVFVAGQIAVLYVIIVNGDKVFLAGQIWVLYVITVNGDKVFLAGQMAVQYITIHLSPICHFTVGLYYIYKLLLLTLFFFNQGSLHNNLKGLVLKG